MKKKFKILLIGAFGAVLSTWLLMASDMFISYNNEGGDEVLMFDNSAPGKWRIRVKETSLKTGEVIKETQKFFCATDELIKSTPNQLVKDKLMLPKNLDCSTMGKRISKTVANFSLSCTGIGENNTELSLKVNGASISEKDIDYLVATYLSTENGEEVAYFKKEYKADRVGSCN